MTYGPITADDHKRNDHVASPCADLPAAYCGIDVLLGRAWVMDADVSASLYNDAVLGHRIGADEEADDMAALTAVPGYAHAA